MCSDCYPYGIDPYKEFTQGGVGIEDFDDEIRYRHAKRKNKAQKVKTRAGCPENEFKAHVYVWTQEFEEKNIFFKFYGFHARESEVCAGCGKKRKSRYSEQYEKRKAREWKKKYGDEFSVKRGEPISRFGKGPRYSWWHWEYNDEEFRAFRKEWAIKHGGNPYYLWW